MCCLCFMGCACCGAQFFAQTVGSMIGSQVLPTYLPERRRRRLLAGLTSVLLLFIPAFACVVHLSRGPEAFIPLVFVLFTHAGCVALSLLLVACRTFMHVCQLYTLPTHVPACCCTVVTAGCVSQVRQLIGFLTRI